MVSKWTGNRLNLLLELKKIMLERKLNFGKSWEILKENRNNLVDG